MRTFHSIVGWLMLAGVLANLMWLLTLIYFLLESLSEGWPTL